MVSAFVPMPLERCIEHWRHDATKGVQCRYCSIGPHNGVHFDNRASLNKENKSIKMFEKNV